MYEHIFHEEEYRGYTIKIIQDNGPVESPRDWDNVGTMECWHSRYSLGDVEHRDSYDEEDFWESLVEEADPDAYNELQDLKDRKYIIDTRYYGASAHWHKRAKTVIRKMREAVIERALEKVAILPLYIYDHSGITMNTGGFSCPWDSGQVGWIWVTKERALKEIGNIDEKNWEQRAREFLKAEVQIYDDYLHGDVGIMIIEDMDGEVIDSCGGYYPDHDVPYSEEWHYPVSEARSTIDYEINENRKARLDRVKTMIKNRVPLDKRPAIIGNL